VNTEVVRSGRDGFLAASPGEWTTWLLALIDDPELRARIGAAARERIVADYSLSALLPRYQSVLASVAGVRKGEFP
jgi:glycosyltransferase involved in cell wall biosynthesis